MVAYREPDGLEKTSLILSALWNEIMVEAHRRRLLLSQIIFWAALFAILLGAETLFSMMLFAILQIEIMGIMFSGAAFALLTPTVLGYAHVRLHHEGDHFLRWWLKTLSGIGVLIFAIAMSLSIGYAAWLAMQDATDVIASGTIGTIGGETIGGDANASSGIVGWIGIIPSSLLFLGLSFGMIITISFTSFCLGRALEAFNMLTLTPRISKDVKTLIESGMDKIAVYRKLGDKDAAERRKLPFDIKTKFASEAAHAVRKAGQAKLAAARRRFDPVTQNDPLAAIVPDAAAGAIPAHFKTCDEFERHIGDVIDARRPHKLLTILNGIPDGKDTL